MFANLPAICVNEAKQQYFSSLRVYCLRQKPAERIRSAWLCAGFSVVLICACAAPMAVSQDGTAAKAEDPARSETASVDHPGATSAANSKSVKTTARSGTKTQAHRRRSSLLHGKRRKVARGQQKIDPERAQEIQAALIREHYLSGRAAGTWNQASEDAMRRYQADHGWQSKTVPDSRALISLGLGPSHDHLLNPESAMTSQPAPAHGTEAQAASIHASSSSAAAPTSPATKIEGDPAPISQPAAGDPSGPQ
jgi:hypothetical protein